MNAPDLPPASNNPSALWDAAVEHARRTGRARPRAVLLLYPDGAVSELRADGTSAEEWGDTPGPFPPASGWAFRAGLVAFGPVTFRLSGLRLKLLRALVGAAGEPVRDRTLKARVWGDTRAEDSRLKDVAFGLRAVLRAELALADGVDPVERVEGGYRLALA